MNVNYGLKLMEKDILSRCFHTFLRFLFLFSFFIFFTALYLKCSSQLHYHIHPFLQVLIVVCVFMFVCMCMEAQICQASNCIHFNFYYFYQVPLPESWAHKLKSDNLELMSSPSKFSKITADSCFMPDFYVVSGDLNSQSSYLYSKRCTHWVSSLRPVYFFLLGCFLSHLDNDKC